MSELKAPKFLEIPEIVWVDVEDVRTLSSQEYACVVRGLGKEVVAIVPSTTLCESQNRIQAIKVGLVDDSLLVDLPFGERVLVSESMVHTNNGNTI